MEYSGGVCWVMSGSATFGGEEVPFDVLGWESGPDGVGGGDTLWFAVDVSVEECRSVGGEGLELYELWSWHGCVLLSGLGVASFGDVIAWVRDGGGDG